jgi:hypothetical protein
MVRHDGTPDLMGIDLTLAGLNSAGEEFPSSCTS